MVSFTSTTILMALSVALSGVQAHVVHGRPSSTLVCYEDRELRALERFSGFANEFCPEFLARTGKHPRWLEHWNMQAVSSACSCYEKTATATGAQSTPTVTGSLLLTSTAPAPLSSVFATTTGLISAFATTSASGGFYPSEFGSTGSAPVATGSATGGLFPSGSVSRRYSTGCSSKKYSPTGSVSGGYYPSEASSGGYYPSGTVFGSSGFASASTALPSVPNRGVSPLSSAASNTTAISATSTSATLAPSTTSASIAASSILSQGASSVASSTTPSGTSSLPAGDNYPPQPPGAGPGKRGLVYNANTQDGWSDLFKGSQYATYGSNGGLDRGSQLDDSFSYVPTLVVDSSLNNAEWNTAVPVLIEGGTKAIFFSPEIENSQTNLTASQAATVYQKYMQPYAGTVQLGTPSIINGDGELDLSYLEDFVTNCASCNFNFIDARFFLERSDATVSQYGQAVHDFLENDLPPVQAKYPQLDGLPVFISGWWLNGVSLEEGGELMTDLLPYLDNKPNVLAHQAYAGLLEGGLVNAAATGLTPAGQAYNGGVTLADVSPLFG